MKKTRVVHLLIALLLALSLLPAAAPAQAQAAPAVPEGEFVPGELVIGFDASVKVVMGQATALAGSVDAQVVKVFDQTAVISFDPAADVTAVAARLAGQPGVRFVEPNYVRRLPEQLLTSAEPFQLKEVDRKLPNKQKLTVEELLSMRTVKRTGGKVQVIPTYPNDEFENWGNSWIGHDIIWPEKKMSPVVCVIDTGVDINHPDLKGRAINGYDFVNDDKIADDHYGHGTHVAGTIAAKANNGMGPAGISNGKVLAVKVLSDQGWGTSADIAAGIRYCANNKAVKVLNLSLGGSEGSAVEYDALHLAVNQGKFVAMAAGNASTSEMHYPAAFASPLSVPPVGSVDDGGANTIHEGMVSVGAIASEETWVDMDGNGIDDDGEYFEGCAAYFSNYGAWVEIVAPGEDIFSTIPVSYPSVLGQYMMGSDAAYLNGTSMATPHVAAAAARVWSLDKKLTNADVEGILMDSGRPVILAVDPNVVDPTVGSSDSGYLGEMPFCWPFADVPFTAAEDMENAVELDLAAAMGRGALTVFPYDAVTGLPLAGAQVAAVDAVTNKVMDIAAVEPPFYTFPAVDLINLPVGPYNARVKAKGYTAGWQPAAMDLFATPGVFESNSAEHFLVIPPAGDFQVVSQWDWWNFFDELDSYLWLPDATPFIVGPEKYDGIMYPNNPYSEVGAMWEFPFARYQRFDEEDLQTWEVLSIKRAGAKVKLPGDYQVLFTDNGDGTLLNQWIKVTAWFNGKVIGGVVRDFTADACDPLLTEAWWHAGTVNGKTFTAVDACGTDAIWPYIIP
ncbi:S8 family serine peptidase [Levilinea saccharolytica]|uniref:Subtilisin-like serine proteases n=1 Tax=Levilinea saccharolytica TaxID=229921 RepID=A0A0M8JQ05_9CHLR|nr:S8 family serine peptidase [Levilinea saccharolytica]KPL80931.1 hypothetical protein ADN01_10605 [Levilinea saccharolytica]GAP19289.1 subtilisin-like serine proteases [Levilinea saccharolytica]